MLENALIYPLGLQLLQNARNYVQILNILI